MRDAGDQAAERGELLGRDQALLRLAQVLERALGALLRGAQFVLGLALGDGVLAEHFERARHVADLVARLGAADQVIVFLRDDRLHRIDDLLERQADAARHQHAEHDDQRQEHDRDQRDVLVDVGERMVEAALGLQLPQRHLGGQLVDHLDHRRLIVVDRGAQQVGPGRELFAEVLQALAEGGGALSERAQRGALQVVLGEIDHDRDGLLDGRDSAARLVGRIGGQRQVEGVGGDQARGERLARLAERRPEQRVAFADRAFDDGVEPGHLLGGLEHVVFVGLLDRGLDLANLAEALQKPLGHRAQFVGRAGQDRIDRAAVAQRAEHLAVQAQDLGEDLGARLVDVAMDQVLQPARLALERDQQLVGFPHLADVLPGAAEHVGAVPDQRRENDRDRGVQRRDRQQAPADRQPADDALGLQVDAPPRPGGRPCRQFLRNGSQFGTH